MTAILILGASYGLLPGAKLSLAGHAVTLVGRSDEIAIMAKTSLEVRITPRRAGDDIVLRVPVADRASAGHIALATPDAIDPSHFDFVILAMQEPQYSDPAVSALMARIAASARPCLSIMNLAPPPFLARLGVDTDKLDGVFHSVAVWTKFNPNKVTLASPDPQAVRPDPAAPGLLICTLPSNFKAAPFAIAEDQLLLQKLASDMSRLEVAVGDASVRPPVALVASSSVFVPLAKWPMLITGNCRCVLETGVRSIAEAVLTDMEASAALYEQVRQLTLRLGAREQDLVSFQSYAETASRLVRPSSLARALEAGVFNVERIDRLISILFAEHGLDGGLIAPVVEMIEKRLTRNRMAAKVTRASDGPIPGRAAEPNRQVP
jgi:hypothetical protein